ncbi:MAG: DNA-directed RNA polymerase subunit omega [Christensenellales bacterium]
MSIDKLVDKIGCKYALVIVTAARTFPSRQETDMLESTWREPHFYAAKELYEGSVVAENED